MNTEPNNDINNNDFNNNDFSARILCLLGLMNMICTYLPYNINAVVSSYLVCINLVFLNRNSEKKICAMGLIVYILQFVPTVWCIAIFGALVKFKVPFKFEEFVQLLIVSRISQTLANTSTKIIISWIIKIITYYFYFVGVMIVVGGCFLLIMETFFMEQMDKTDNEDEELINVIDHEDLPLDLIELTSKLFDRTEGCLEISTLVNSTDPKDIDEDNMSSTYVKVNKDC